MKKINLGIEFFVNDLSASYEIIGTSDNYSFEYSIGIGRDLVDYEGEKYFQSIDLKGNYGDYDVRVYAVNGVGIRSKYIQESISISAPKLEGTFMFTNLINSTDSELLDNHILSEPTEDDNQLIVDSNFVGKNVSISWALIAPNGHPKEGTPLTNELLSDPLFDRFEIKIYNGKERILITESQMNDSLGMQASLSTSDVSSVLSSYRDFSIEINSQTFEDLSLDRDFQVEIKCFNAYEQSSSAYINLFNKIPYISNFRYENSSGRVSFAWDPLDIDYAYTKIKYLGVPAGNDLLDYSDIDISSIDASEVLDAPVYREAVGFNFKIGEKYLYEDGNVYEVLLDHVFGVDKKPTNSSYWVNRGVFRDVVFGEEDSSKSTFSLKVRWGYSYYFSLEAYDKYGIGFKYNLTDDGLTEKSSSALLKEHTYLLKISDLRYREQGDSLVFFWDIKDNLDQVVDIAQLKSSEFVEDSNILGIAATLSDTKTNQIVYDITPGFNDSVTVNDPINGRGVAYGVKSTKIFDSFDFNRELNNFIYPPQGFPAEADFFEVSKFYSPTGNKYAVYEESLFVSKLDSQYSFDNISINAQPSYEQWNSNITYQANYDYVIFDNVLYKTIQKFGIESDLPYGLFDENLSYNQDTVVSAPLISDISFFNTQSAYEVEDFVYYKQKTYRCIRAQGAGFAVYPDLELNDYWVLLSIGNDISYALFKCNSSTSPGGELPFNDSSVWIIQDPSNSPNHFSKVAEVINESVYEWNSQESFLLNDYVSYDNDLWVALQDSGPETAYGSVEPSIASDLWSNEIDSSDITLNYNSGDIVLYRNALYKSLEDNPSAGPIDAVSYENTRESLCDYSGCGWMPFWEIDNSYEEYPLLHVGIPEGGKRGIGLNLFLLDNSEQIISTGSLIAKNPAPYILYDDNFNTDGSVDSISEVTKVKFDFKYALNFQEKVTKVHLYRSSQQDFSITGSNKLPYSEVRSESNPDSTLVKVMIGDGDANFGENITRIEDSPPLAQVLDFENYVKNNQHIYEKYILEDPLENEEEWGERYWSENSGVESVEPVYKEAITGYYYKILPFDDFGSGVLHDVRINGDSLVHVYPKSYHSSRTSTINGPVVRAFPTNSQGLIPLAVENLRGQSSFKNYFLNWSTRDNDVDYFEVWSSKLDFNGDTESLITGQKDGQTGYLEQHTNTGYRKIDGLIYSIGDEVPRQNFDDLGSWQIRNASKIFEVSANAKEVEVVYPGEERENRSFWVRPVDFAGNKGPFTGAYIDQDEYIKGVNLTLGSINLADVGDVENTLTEKFSNTIALEPNNPFITNPDMSVSWGDHKVYYSGQSFDIQGTSSNSQRYIYDSMNDGYVWWRHPENYYQTGINHPANNNSIDDGDFIIARVRNGVATPSFSVFANALIGTANIASASIIDAQIKELRADKIQSDIIKGKDIQISQGPNGEEGGIRSVGFNGVDHTSSNRQGFFVSGDGTFGFQAGGTSLSLDEDGSLSLRGRLRQSDGFDYDFIDFDVNPNYFGYTREDQQLILNEESPSELDISVIFRNSSVRANEVRFKMVAIMGDQSKVVFDYDDYDNSVEGKYDISGFEYFANNNRNDFIDGSESEVLSQETKIAKAKFKSGKGDVVGFDDIMRNSFSAAYADSVVLYAKSTKTTYEKSVTIPRLNDGKIGKDGLPGDSIDIIFKRSSDPPSTPNASESTPGGWTTNSDDLTGAGVVWASRGIKVAALDYYTWSDPFQVEGKAIAEVYLYYLVDSDGNAPTNGPTGVTFDFTENEVDVESIPNGWSRTIPQLQNNQEVYASVGLASGGSKDTAASVSFGSPALYAKFVQGENGENGENGASPTFLGKWEDLEAGYEIIGKENNPNRGDVVEYVIQGENDKYWICKESHPKGSSFNTSQWEPFGATFKSVATDLLLAEDAIITSTFTVGKYTDAGEGEGDSYFRFDSNLGKLSMRGAVVNNTTKTDIGKDLLRQSVLPDYDDDVTNATFVAGGYENKIDDPGTNNSFKSLGSSIVGGAYNEIAGRFSFIGNGFNNQCFDNFSAIVAGFNNSMPKLDSANEGANFIGGGQNNVIDGGTNQSILGGSDNTIKYD